MTKNCERKQQWLDRYLREELNPVDRAALAAHLATCPECRDALEFRRSLDARLAGSAEAPVALRAKFDAAKAAPTSGWLTRTLGDKTMKRILISSTALAAVLGCAILLIPGPAHATTAKAKFGSMRTAMRKLAQEGMLSVTVALNGTSEPTFNVLLDGQPLPPDVPINITSVEDGKFVDYTVTIDLSDAIYSSLKFGADQNTLELIPKADPDHRDIVHVDPKTGKPLDWQTLELKNGSWDNLYNVCFSDADTKVYGTIIAPPHAVTHNQPAPGSKPSDDVITIHIRVAKDGGNATVSVKNNG